MNLKGFNKLEEYMLYCMSDSAHDKEHVYRVLYTAIDIASYESDIDYDILIASCLLHDIGRSEETKDKDVNHALVGAEKAYLYLLKQGYNKEFALKVKECIETHRFRVKNPPNSIEAKILYDADKLDTCGTIGIARTLLWLGRTNSSLYRLSDDYELILSKDNSGSSFLQEYNYKLKNLYGNFYTKRGNTIAEQRRCIAEQFYQGMISEVEFSYNAIPQLEYILKEDKDGLFKNS